MFDLTKKYLSSSFEELKLSDVYKIQELIKYHSDLYYNKQQAIISDKEYDDLFKLLTILEKKFDIKNKESLKVWASVNKSTFEKVKHSRPMISLWNTYNENDLYLFDERVKKNLNLNKWESNLLDISKLEYVLEFKFDWLWIELIYKNWKLIQAITRWNWIEWEDVTQNILQIDNIPKQISYKHDFEVRWEVVMPISVFNELNKKAKKNWEKVFSNPRNAASWSLRLLDSNITKERKLKFFAYDLANFEDFIQKENIKKYYELIKKIESFWFEISSYFNKTNWIKQIIENINNFWELKKELNFEIDWLVLKVNNIGLWTKIWFTQHHPRYAIAYKFPAEIMTTKVVWVEHSIWRTGTITPIANLEPINIWWVIVKRATLHNYDEIKNLWLKIWDYVFIKRAWEVIPKIIWVNDINNKTEKIDILIPKVCPSCWSSVLKDNTKVRYYCSNKITCPAQNSEWLAWSVWKQWFNIDWLWEKQIKIFLNFWIINNLFDIFNLENKFEEIIALEWFQEKSISNLIKAINDSKNIDISNFLTALWISWVGKKTAKTISKLFSNKNDLIDFNYKLSDLEQLEDIWPEISKNILEYFDNDFNKNLINNLLKILKITYYTKNEKILKTWYFLWKKMCITWSFKDYNREELAEILEKNGWSFVTSISKKTDYLLIWEKAWSKLKKAKDLWIIVLEINDFLNKIKT